MGTYFSSLSNNTIKKVCDDCKKEFITIAEQKNDLCIECRQKLIINLEALIRIKTTECKELYDTYNFHVIKDLRDNYAEYL
jgi:DNA-directed RNA polymerase subunit RPC12/RpoP